MSTYYIRVGRARLPLPRWLWWQAMYFPNRTYARFNGGIRDILDGNPERAAWNETAVTAPSDNNTRQGGE